MDEPTVLNDDQLSRLRRIWTTEIGRCGRNSQHRILNTIPPLQKHFTSVEGSMVHLAIEQSLKGVDENLPLDDYPQYKPRLMEELPSLMEKARIWKETTKVDLSEAESEVKFEMPIGLGYTLVRSIDILTPEWIIDIKKGKKVQTESRYDVLISKKMVESAGEGPRKMMIVLLGNDTPVEYEMYGKGKRTSEEVDMNFIELGIQNVLLEREMIRTGKQVPCKIDFLCGFCEYRHLCNGV